MTSDSSVLALMGGTLGEQSRGCPAGPTFPEGGWRTFILPWMCPEPLGFPANWSHHPPPSTHTSYSSPLHPRHRPCPGPSRTPQLRHQAHLWGECSCAFLCNKSKCMCRCSVFLQTHLLGCYKIKTIFSLSKCFPSKSLEVHNSPAHLQLLFSWGYKEIMIVGPVSF